MRPDLDDLIGTDIEPGERARLERVHELLVAAGPPPELSPPGRRARRHRRRRGAAARDRRRARGRRIRAGRRPRGRRPAASTSWCRWTPRRRHPVRPRRWRSSISTTPATGRWSSPSRASTPRAGDRPFQLWLTRKGEREALCGAFVTAADGSAVVPMNAPYRLRRVRRLGRRRGAGLRDPPHFLTTGALPGPDALSSDGAPSTRTSCATSSRRAAEERPHRDGHRQRVRLPDALRPHRRLPARDHEESALQVRRSRAPLVPAR